MLSFEILPKKNIDIDAWRFVKDQVMGGKSDGSMSLEESANENFDFISAKGNVSTDGGGFLMFRKEIDSRCRGEPLVKKKINNPYLVDQHLLENKNA